MARSWAEPGDEIGEVLAGEGAGGGASLRAASAWRARARDSCRAAASRAFWLADRRS